MTLDLGVYKSDKSQVSLLDEYRNELQQAKSVDDVLIILRRHMSFFNYEILSHIIRHVGSDSDNMNLERYCSQFKTFCKYKLCVVLRGDFDPSVREKKNGTLFAVFGAEDLLETLSDVKTAQRKIASLLSLKTSTLQLKRIDIGQCVILVFSIPTSLNDLFPLGSSKRERLKSNGYTPIIPCIPAYQKDLTPVKIEEAITSSDDSLKFKQSQPRSCLLTEHESKEISEDFLTSPLAIFLPSNAHTFDSPDHTKMQSNSKVSQFIAHVLRYIS